jgi:sigma-B regulation protein RsbU (phosphoserine phosphatase)
MQVLVVDPAKTLTDQMTGHFQEQGWGIQFADHYLDANQPKSIDSYDAVILREPDPGDDKLDRDFHALIRQLDSSSIATLLMASRIPAATFGEESLIDIVDHPLSPQEIGERLRTLSRFRKYAKRMERELHHMQKLGLRLNSHFEELTEELRLAGRLQRDFLPKMIKPLGPAHFQSIYRPASWVSGDIFDVFRIDEKHIGFYVADAVGHGLAAGLLTMFIKTTIKSKVIERDSYRVLAPEETLANLNESLAAVQLPNAQFVTCFYGVLNTETLELRHARGGHPYAIVMGRDGRMTEVKAHGGLLGLFPGAEFTGSWLQLKPGDRIVVYTDGLENHVSPEHADGEMWAGIRGVLAGEADLTLAEYVEWLARQLDNSEGSLSMPDDVTILAMEVETPNG